MCDRITPLIMWSLYIRAISLPWRPARGLWSCSQINPYESDEHSKLKTDLTACQCRIGSYRAASNGLMQKRRNSIANTWSCVLFALCQRNPQKLRCSYTIKHKNIERHTAHTIVSSPNPKQWVIVHISDLIMIIRQVYIYIFSQSSQRKWVNWKHTAPHIV